MAFAAGVAGGLTVALLNDQKQPNIINNYYYPLSKEQAQLYMQTEKYKHYTDILLTNILMFKSKEGKFKYFYWTNPKTHKVHYPTPEEFKKYRDKLRKQLQEKHLVILQTEGIGKLPKHDGNWKEITTSDKVCCCCPIIFCPCCKDDDNGYDYGDQRVPYVEASIVDQTTGEIKRYQKKLAIIKV